MELFHRQRSPHSILLQRRDDDRVRMYVERHDIPRHVVAHRHLKAVALTDGVERGTLVFAYYGTLHVEDGAACERYIPCEKIFHRNVADETKSLAVGFCRIRKSVPFCERTYFRFAKLAHRKERMRKVFLLEPVEKV